MLPDATERSGECWSLRHDDEPSDQDVVLLIDEPFARVEEASSSAKRAVFILAVAETVSWGLLYYSFSVMLGPTAARLHATEAEVSGAFSLALLAAGAVAPFVGRAVDRRGAGAVMVIGSVLGAIGFSALAFVTSVIELYAVWICLGVAHGLSSYEPAFTAVTRWFEDLDARRRALLVITSFGGLASTIFVPIAAWLVSSHGLRTSALVFAGVLCFFVTPLHGLVALVPRPEPSVRPNSVAAAPPRAALATLACVFALHAFASMGASAFLFPSLVDRGVSVPNAAELAALVGAAQVPARLFYEPLCRIVPGKARLSLLLIAQAIAIAGWGLLDGAPRIIALVAFGASNGLGTLERATVIGEWFGVHGYGARSGLLAAVSAITRAAAPITIAVVASRTSYAHAFVGLGGALVVASWVLARRESRRSGPS